MLKVLNKNLVLGLVLAGMPLLRAQAAPDATNSGRIVVMISVDGLAADYLDNPKAGMTNLQKLASEGARASMMRASTPTVTWPNHTTLVTGDNPARHGVVGNNYFDRVTGKNVRLISDPVYDKDQIVKVPTIYDVAKEAGLTTAAIRWPATRNAKTLDWTIPSVGDSELARKYTTPALIEECEAAGLPIPGINAKKVKKKAAKAAKGEDQAGEESSTGDDRITAIFDFILHQNHPNLALLHVANVDHTQHLNGPRTEAAFKAVHSADQEIGEVWKELQTDYPGRATLIVVSDHGFSVINRTLLPNVLLLKAGLLDSDAKDAGGAVHLTAQGGCGLLYIRDEAHHDEIVAKVRKALAGMQGLEKILGPKELKEYGVADYKVDPHAPDLMLLADEGYSFGDTAAGSMTFDEKPERRGSHGHDSKLPDLHATFVAWGVGIKPGVNLGEISNTDVAPTIAKLLKINLPNTDGRPLMAALSQ